MMNSLVLRVFIGVIFLLGFSLFLRADPLNPDHIYIYKGEAIGNRSLIVGDPKNWYEPISGRKGQSADGAISVNPVDFKGTGDAIQLTWHKKSVQGNFTLSGAVVDLAKYKDLVYLTIDMCIDQKPKADVKIGMDCGYPCGASLKIDQMIKSMKVGEWFSLPLPLNCFKGEQFDLSKITGPFTISTNDKFTISITNVRLEKYAEGETGCAQQ